jgi:hypothetical protein
LPRDTSEAEYPGTEIQETVDGLAQLFIQAVEEEEMGEASGG